MFGAAAVRNKKRKAENAANAANAPRGPYIKPFGPRFDPNELPYFKYKRAFQIEFVTLKFKSSRHTPSLQRTANVYLEPSGAPVDELDVPLLLDHRDGRVDVLRHHVPAVQDAAAHVLAASLKREIGALEQDPAVQM